MSRWTVDRLSTAMSIECRSLVDRVSIDISIEYRSRVDRYSIEMSIEGIDRHSIADAVSTHDPTKLHIRMNILKCLYGQQGFYSYGSSVLCKKVF